MRDQRPGGTPPARDLPPDDVMPRRHGAQLKVRVLDPLTAHQVQGQASVRPAAFVADSLLVRGFADETVDALTEVTAEAGFELRWDPRGEEDERALDRAEVSDEERTRLRAVWVRRVRIAPADRHDVFKPIDTWRLLQA